MTTKTTNPANDLKKAQLSAFRKTYVPFAASKKLLKTLNDHYLNGCSDDVAQCMMLIGESRVGKSKSIDKFIELATVDPMGPIFQDGMEIDPLPILRIDVPANIRGKALVEAMLAALGDPSPNRGTLAAMTERLKLWCKRRGVKLIILDEIQHLVDRSRVNPKTAYDVGDWIKNLLNSGLCPIVLSGTPDATVILSNEQLRARCTSVVRLEPFSFTTKDEQGQFRAILGKFDEALGFPQLCGLNEMSIAQRIHAATRGHIGLVTRLLEMALRQAQANDLTTIDQDLLADVHAMFAPWPNAKENPFLTAAPPLYQSAKDKCNGHVQEQVAKRSKSTPETEMGAPA